MRFVAALNTRIYGVYYAQSAEVDTTGWSRKQLLQFLGNGIIQASVVTAGAITDSVEFTGDGVSTYVDGDGVLVVVIEGADDEDAGLQWTAMATVPLPSDGNVGDLWLNTYPVNAVGNFSKAVIEVWGPKLSVEDAGDPDDVWGTPIHVNGLDPHGYQFVDGTWLFSLKADMEGSAPLYIQQTEPAIGTSFYMGGDTAGLWYDGADLHLVTQGSDNTSIDRVLGESDLGGDGTYLDLVSSPPGDAGSPAAGSARLTVTEYGDDNAPGVYVTNSAWNSFLLMSQLDADGTYLPIRVLQNPGDLVVGQQFFDPDIIAPGRLSPGPDGSVLTADSTSEYGLTYTDIGNPAADLAAHVNAASPHPAYDDIASLTLLFENGLV